MLLKNLMLKGNCYLKNWELEKLLSKVNLIRPRTRFVKKNVNFL